MSPRRSQTADNIEQVADSTNLPLWHRVNTVNSNGHEALRPLEWRQEVRALIASGKWHPAVRTGLFCIGSS